MADAADPLVVGGATVLMTLRSEAVGVHCTGGGSRIGAGFDVNANGLLESAEVTSTQYVCNGADGAAGAAGVAGLTTLVQMSIEPAGINCPAEGKKISVGVDRNTNGVLDLAEQTSSGFVCNGSNGTNGSDGTAGANGTAGRNSLIALGVEAAGANCGHGGSKLASGLDANANNVLEGAEITTTSYVCNGAPGPGVTWVDVSTTSVQAESSKGYLANNIDQVTITLPVNPSFGDLVQFSGVGPAGGGLRRTQGRRSRRGTCSEAGSERAGPRGSRTDTGPRSLRQRTALDWWRSFHILGTSTPRPIRGSRGLSAIQSEIGLRSHPRPMARVWWQRLLAHRSTPRQIRESHGRRAT